MTQPAVLATKPEDYRRFGITTEIQPFEDGLRTDPARSGHYEWWYFDAHLDDGSTLVVTFYTKDFAAPSGGLAPMITIDLDLPDGRTINKRAVYDPATFSSSSEGCDVRIDGHRFVGDLHEYRITATVDEVSVDVTLTGQTEPWRPATGHIVYGEDSAQVFAWLPAVPHGAAEVTYIVDGTSTTTAGHGYHDHNWGNAPLLSVVNNWYWGRGAAGPYTFITAQIISEKKYGYGPITVFMLAKDGRVVADDQSKVTFDKSDLHADPMMHKPVAQVHSYTYDDGTDRYELSYRRSDTLLRTPFIDAVHGVKRIAARLVGFDGCYLRFGGTIDVTAVHNGARTTLTEDAIWELMYFGRHGHEGTGG